MFIFTKLAITIISEFTIIRRVKDPLSPRDCGIEPYAGKIGEVVDYHWISPRPGEVFYIYTVRVGADEEEIVLYEDEIKAYIK